MPNYVPAQGPLRVTHCPKDRLLHVRWTAPVDDPRLSSHFFDVLTAARNQSWCRFWLVDMRGCPWPRPAHWQWLGGPYARYAAQVLGHPLFVAFVLDPSHYQYVYAQPTKQALCTSANYDVYPYFFDNDADARDWLLHQQALDLAVAAPQQAQAR